MTVTQIQVRRGTAAEWAAENPILAEGEQGFETDTRKWKVGDGVDLYNDLPYDRDTNAILPFFLPEDYGATGNGVTDDGPALQAAIDAAKAAGGGVVYLTSIYAWAGDIVHKSAVTVQGVGASSFGQAGVGIKALDGTSRYRYGDLTGDPYPGPLENLVIDGNSVGGATQLVRMEAVEGVIRDVFIVDGVGDGIDFASSQNCLLDHVSCGGFPTGAAYRLRNRDDAGGTQGPGGNKIISCYGHTANDLVKADTTDAVNFWPHDNIFIGCLFEQYQDNVNSIVHLADGETLFKACVFTGSSGLLTATADAVVLIENQLRPALPTYGTFEDCYFGGGAVGVTHVIRSKSYGLANILTLVGRSNVANANKVGSFFLCDDRGPGGGLGLVARVMGPCDGVTGNIGFITGINGGSAGALIYEGRSPVRYRMDATVANPVQLRRDGESFNRWQITRDGNMQWLDGTSATIQANILRSGAGLSINGENFVQIATTVTALRPAASTVPRRLLLDGSLNKLIWSDGTNWRDAMGTIV